MILILLSMESDNDYKKLLLLDKMISFKKQSSEFYLKKFIINLIFIYSRQNYTRQDERGYSRLLTIYIYIYIL
jgi:hypothetical protein